MIFNYQKHTSPSGITISVGEEVTYPTYNGFESKTATITHIVSHVNEDFYYVCMSNGDVVQDSTIIAAKFDSLEEEDFTSQELDWEIQDCDDEDDEEDWEESHDAYQERLEAMWDRQDSEKS